MAEPTQPIQQPVSRIDPFGPPGTAVPRPGYAGPRINWWAVSGLLLCLSSAVPLAWPQRPGMGWVGGAAAVAAIVAGIIGIRRADDIMTRGRAMATTALVGGVLALSFWVLAGNRAPTAVRDSEAPRRVARDFLRELAAGNRAVAQASADPVAVGPMLIEQWVEQIEARGPMGQIAFSRVAMQRNPDRQATQCSLSGTVEFPNGRPMPFDIDVVEAEGRWVVLDLRLP